MKKKTKKKVIILGAGALGSNLLASLLPDAREIAEFTILDFDIVAQRNLNIQFFLREQVGMKKTETLQYNLYRWIGRKVEIITEKLTKENAPQLLKDFDLIIDTFDNKQARQIVQDFAIKNKVDCLHCGFSELMTFEVCWAENYTVPDDSLSDFDVCEADGAASFIRLASATGANAALAFLLRGEKRGFVGNSFSVREVI